MFSKVIIATDLSPVSMAIIDKAPCLSQLGTKQIHLLQCITPLEAASLAYSESEIKMKVLLAAQKNKLTGFGFKTTAEVVFGSIHTEINRVATDGGYSLVMLGSKGMTFSKDMFLGGVVSELIQRAEKPTLVVRVGGKESEENEICILPETCSNFQSSILFPTDFSANAAQAFEYVKKLSGFGSECITLVHVQDMIKLEKSSANEIAEFDRIDLQRLEELKMKLAAGNKKMTITIKLLHGKPAVEILKESENIQPSLIVMGTQGRGYLKEIVLGSVSHMVTRKSKTSVFLVPNNN